MEAFACKLGIKINDIPALKQSNSQQTKSENAALKCRAHFLQLFSVVKVKLLLIYGRVEKWCSQEKGDEGNCLKNPGNFFSFQDSRWDLGCIRFNSIAVFIGVICAIFSLCQQTKMKRFVFSFGPWGWHKLQACKSSWPLLWYSQVRMESNSRWINPVDGLVGFRSICSS